MDKITMQEIARKAGVSLATVSRTIHSPQLVHAETRKNILRVMKKHHYVYNATAGDLSRKRSTVLGMIIPTTQSNIFGNTTMAIQEKAQELGFSVIIGNSKYDTGVEKHLLQQFQERGLAGVILTGFTIGQEDSFRKLVERGIPCVVIWEKIDDAGVCYVGFDNQKAAFSMTEYLIGLGHRRIGLIIGPFSKVGRVRKRLEGYRLALETHGIPFLSELVIEKEPRLTDGKEAMGALLSLPERPTAVFAASDVLAIGAMSAAWERGVRIPEDISVAGFDDIDFAAYTVPPLTTMRVPGREMGHLAVETIIDWIHGKMEEPRQFCLAAELVIRGSCRDISGRT